MIANFVSNGPPKSKPEFVGGEFFKRNDTGDIYRLINENNSWTLVKFPEGDGQYPLIPGCTWNGRHLTPLEALGKKPDAFTRLENGKITIEV